MTEIDMNPTDNVILDELQDGRVTPNYVASKHGYTRGNVSNRLTRLIEHGYVRRLGGEGSGLYELIDDPRDGDDNE